jgi:hypothetical protein
MNINKTQKNAKEFICDNCLFGCSKQSDWNRHILRPKHINNINNINKTPKNAYICDCGKLYKYYSGRWNHKKKCIINSESPKNETPKNETLKNETPKNETPNDNFKALTNLVLELVKSNNDLQTQMIEVCKNSNSNSNNINNSHNKTFNLQVFLNEDCKDAMNLSDFVNSLQLQLSDLDNMGKLGYTEGISKIIINEMNDLEQTKRPVHCSDIKRETLYVKDEDKWEKEQPDHPKLNKAIRKIEQKNFGLMSDWQAEHPTYMESTSEENNEFLKLISQTVNGTSDNINKVIKKIAKEVIITKE